jgi:hypothetical protein
VAAKAVATVGAKVPATAVARAAATAAVAITTTADATVAAIADATVAAIAVATVAAIAAAAVVAAARLPARPVKRPSTKLRLPPLRRITRTKNRMPRRAPNSLVHPLVDARVVSARHWQACTAIRVLTEPNESCQPGFSQEHPADFLRSRLPADCENLLKSHPNPDKCSQQGPSTIPGQDVRAILNRWRGSIGHE